MSYDPEISLPVLNHRYFLPNKEAYLKMFSYNNKWELPQCTLIEKWSNYSYVHLTEFYTTVKKNKVDVSAPT